MCNVSLAFKVWADTSCSHVRLPPFYCTHLCMRDPMPGACSPLGGSIHVHNSGMWWPSVWTGGCGCVEGCSGVLSMCMCVCVGASMCSATCKSGRAQRSQRSMSSFQRVRVHLHVCVVCVCVRCVCVWCVRNGTCAFVCGVAETSVDGVYVLGGEVHAQLSHARARAHSHVHQV